MTLEEAIKQVCETVKLFGDTEYQLGEIRATLLVNFGPTSLSKERYGFQIETEGIHNTHTTTQILMAVLEEFTKRSDAAKKEISMLRYAIDERNKQDEEGPIL